MAVLDRKVLRDVRRMWAQVLAIGLVMACGVMTLIMAQGAYRSLRETQEVYYDQYRFGHLFVNAKRIPKSVVRSFHSLEGVQAVEGRIDAPAILEMEGMQEPGAGYVMSLPVGKLPDVNRPYLREGRLPQASSTREVAIEERFAKAHDLRAGDSFSAIIHGNRVHLRVSGIMLSPEFIYALGPGDLIPDSKRFGVFYMSQKALEALMDMEGAYNSVSLRLLRGACEACVKRQIDQALLPYGSTGAYGRKDQVSNSFIDAELKQLESMSRVMPPVFLLVSAFLVNMILTRLIALEREQIGLLKACGYSSWQVAFHYSKLVILISFVGLSIGMFAGAQIGKGLTHLYSQFFSFPFLVFKQSVDLYLIGIVVSAGSALLGAAKAIYGAASLPPAVAMRPPAPEKFRSVMALKQGDGKFLSQLTVMGLRHFIHSPLRSLMTMFGIAFAGAMAVMALFFVDSINAMIDLSMTRAERSDAQVQLIDDMRPSVLDEIQRLPGVFMAEPVRQEAVIFHHGAVSKRGSILGRLTHSNLSRTLDENNNPAPLPEHGILLPQRLAEQLNVGLGQTLRVEFPSLAGLQKSVRVAGFSSSYLGLAAAMRLERLNRLMGQGPRINAAAFDMDESQAPQLYEAIKSTPGLLSISMQVLSKKMFRKHMDQNTVTMVSVYFIIAVIVAFGVVYNSIRIQLSERGRELASLRVLGFTSGEVFKVMLVEMGAIVVLAQPLSWFVGYGFSVVMINGFANDMYAMPLVIHNKTYAIASIVVFVSALFCAGLAWLRVSKLDLISVLKSRE
ncbi:ABC transporter permease [Polycladidibacter stylochi]|uniref:ABC transporter permease n=1 Tax=Polycladidibacter stylochi TaxID=1807766 RepID=UPI00082AE83B|nr:FtsX-like permease family protein [Pseudovibrio stylochi]